jgi:hypothetical protein
MSITLLIYAKIVHGRFFLKGKGEFCNQQDEFCNKPSLYNFQKKFYDNVRSAQTVNASPPHRKY